ncbi:hypothetical protein B0J15DRAFT_539464 [Fusarium solani]|uniref:Uncharacterized protein n=1 Tax=Fusarium solani TaxID=169388 RepID=A0A9P9G3S0_FUSSL|nr:uncharacterized protein B0J15DRAFT_539464 [Fusarium solani]KAH7231575.1 hypothetical protein B0J15DRAFT_539464 [Fusarium solani]
MARGGADGRSRSPTDGLDKDLAAMAEAGHGGALIKDVQAGLPEGPVTYGSREWLDLVVHAVEGLEKRGVQAAMHNSPGYSGVGSHALPVNETMKELVWTESRITANSSSDTILPKPFSKLGVYQDLFTLTYLTGQGEGYLVFRDAVQEVRINETAVKTNGTSTIDRTNPLRLESKSAKFDIAFKEPFTAQAIAIYRIPELPLNTFDGARDYPPQWSVFVSNYSVDWTSVPVTVSAPALRQMDAPAVITFNQVKAKYLRLVPSGPTWITGIDVSSSPRLPNWAVKSHGAPGTPDVSTWAEHPFQLKATGDRMMTLDPNRFIFHSYVHQPVNSAFPGMTFGPFGTHFDRMNTWAKQQVGWNKHLSRVSYVLQNTDAYVDVACFISEEPSQATVPYNSPYNVPLSYQADIFSRANLLDLKAKDGRASLWRLAGNGNVFTNMTAAEALKAVDLAPNLEFTSPRNDAALYYTHRTDESIVVVMRRKASGSLDSVSKDGHQLWAATPFESFVATPYQNISSSFAVTLWAKPEVAQFGTSNYIFYPTSSYGNGHASMSLTLGTNGIQIGEATTSSPKTVIGLTETANNFTVSGWTHFAIVYENDTPSLYVNGEMISKGSKSTNIVHPGLGQPDAPARMTKRFDGDLAGLEVHAESLDSAEIKAFCLPQWKLGVELPELKSLKDHEDFDIAHFSGTATYKTKFQLPKDHSAKTSRGTKTRVLLNLGRVENIASVKVNGKDQGLVWLPPYEVDITSAVRSSHTNTLEVEVTNCWPNRLIGDEKLPEENEYNSTRQNFAIEEWPDWFAKGLEGRGYNNGDEFGNDGTRKPGDRVTFTSWKHYDESSPLFESGLLGPATVTVAELVDVKV